MVKIAAYVGFCGLKQELRRYSADVPTRFEPQQVLKDVPSNLRHFEVAEFHLSVCETSIDWLGKYCRCLKESNYFQLACFARRRVDELEFVTAAV